MKSIESRLHLKRRLYRFQLKRGLFISEYMNNYKNLLADLVNVDVETKDKAVILMNFLLDEEYVTFVLTLIMIKKTLNYSVVSDALTNYKVRRKNKQFFFK